MAGIKSNNEFDNLEAFFNRRLKDASLEPNDMAWQQIEEELNRQEKQKRKRRFFWFFSSGLLLVCGLASLWFFMPNNKTEKNIAERSIVKETTTQPAKETPPTETSKKNTTNETTTENIETNKTTDQAERSGNLKIQLGAFKQPANPALFSKIPNKVIEVKCTDGYVRYFAEVTGDKNNSLETIKQAGFKDAFIKKHFDETSENTIVKNEGVIDDNNSIITVAKTNSTESKSYSEEKPAAKINTISVNIPKEKKHGVIVKNEAKSALPVTNNEIKNTGETKTSIVNNEPTRNENNSTPVVTNNETKNTSGNSTEQPTGNTQQPEETKTVPIENKNPVVSAKMDTTNSTQVAATENKPDSIPKKEEKKDSVSMPVKIAVIDTSKKIPFIPEWAVLLMGGPNIFMQAANETQPVTYNGETKLQFRPFKYFSFSGGFNFTYFTVQKDATFFKFDKHQTADFLFYSSFGSMAVPMSTVLQGYSVLAPIDTFAAKYSYTSSVQTLNIPLEMNFHFLNTSKFNLYLGIGANSSFAIGQQSHLTIHKENNNNDLSYNNVTVNKFNMLMMMSLGCDVRLNKHLFITGGSSFKYGLTNMSPTKGTTYNPMFISGNLGLKFKF